MLPAARIYCARGRWWLTWSTTRAWKFPWIPRSLPHQLQPAPPEGYYYDVANEEAILTRMKAQNGRIVFPDGLSYRVLVLPEDRRLSLEVLRKVRDMVKEGVALVGPKPQANPGLTAYPQSDAELRQIAEEVWGDLNGSTVTERSYGKGRVFWGLPLWRRFSKSLNIKPDCDVTSRSGDAPINFIHRRVGDAEVYFVANRRRRAEDVVCTFRVKGSSRNSGTRRPARSRRSTFTTRPMREYACRCNSAPPNRCSLSSVPRPPRGLSKLLLAKAMPLSRTDPSRPFKPGASAT